MILTSDTAAHDLDQWRSNSSPISSDTAQTIASWWHSPGAPALSRFSHGMSVQLDDLRDAVRQERDAVRDLPEHEELDALLGWIDLQDGPAWSGFLA